MATKLFNSAEITAQFVAFGVREGLDRDAILAAAGLPPGYDFDPDGGLPFEDSQRTWEYVIRELRDPAAPIRYAQSTDTEDYQALGFAAFSSRNVREGIVRTVRYSELLTNSGHFQLLETPSLAVVTWTRDLPLTLANRVGNETAVAQFLHLCRRATQSQITPLLVTFRHPEPTSIEAHEIFFGCGVEFGGDSDSLHLDPTLLDQPVANADEALSAFFERYLQTRCSDATPEPILVDKVRRSILTSLSSGVPISEHIARALGMSDRSLRRHLKREGTTYRELVRSVRLQAADALLQDPRTSIAEVAFLLGYGDAGAFSRAFRRQTGHSPKDHRHRGPGEA